MMRVAVIGAGPAGLTAAYQLAKAGVEVDVFDDSPEVGGPARSLHLWGQTVDLGPQPFVCDDERVRRLWLEVVEQDYQMLERRARILDRERFLPSPPTAKALASLGPREAARCVGSYLKARLRPTATDSEESLERWGVRQFGRRGFEVFFKTYCEKLWGVPCDRLDAKVAAELIQTQTPGESQANRGHLGLTRARASADRFAYPVEGAGMVYARMADYIRGLGGRVHVNCPLRGVLHDQGRVQGLRLASGDTQPFAHVISTMPLPGLVQELGDTPPAVLAAAESLRYRNTIVVYLQVGSDHLFPDQWLEVHSPELLMGRITNFRNWTPQLYGRSPNSILALEYWCADDDSLWSQTDVELILRGKAEVITSGLLRGAPVLGGHVVRLRHSFAVLQRGYQQPLRTVIDYLGQVQGLTAIGRYNAVSEDAQQRELLLGLLAAENLLENKEHDLWSVGVGEKASQRTLTAGANGLALAQH